MANNLCQHLFLKSSSSQFETQINKTKTHLKYNWFVTARGLQEYISQFKFKDFLFQLTPHHRWLDSGAGRALAQKEYLNQATAPAQTTAVSYKKPWFVWSKKNLNYMSDRFIEDISDQELGQFDLITDFFGPYSYTDNPVAIINKYLRLLNTNGRIYLSFISEYSAVINSDKSVIALHQWIVHQLKQHPNYFRIEIQQSVLMIEILAQNQVQLPGLKLEYFSAAELVPVRKYSKDP